MFRGGCRPHGNVEREFGGPDTATLPGSEAAETCCPLNLGKVGVVLRHKFLEFKGRLQTSVEFLKGKMEILRLLHVLEVELWQASCPLFVDVLM